MSRSQLIFCDSDEPMWRLLYAVAALALPAVASAEAAAQQAAAAAKPQYHVVELHNSDTVTLEQVLGAFEKLGASKEKVMPLIDDSALPP